MLSKFMIFHTKNWVLGKDSYESHTLFIVYLDESHTLFGEKLYFIWKFISGNTEYDIQTRGQPIVVICICVERHNGSHNYLFTCVGLTRRRNPPLICLTRSDPSTFNAFVKAFNLMLGRECSVPSESRIHLHRYMKAYVPSLVMQNIFTEMR